MRTEKTIRRPSFHSHHRGRNTTSPVQSSGSDSSPRSRSVGPSRNDPPPYNAGRTSVELFGRPCNPPPPLSQPGHRSGRSLNSGSTRRLRRSIFEARCGRYRPSTPSGAGSRSRPRSPRLSRFWMVSRCSHRRACDFYLVVSRRPNRTLGLQSLVSVFTQITPVYISTFGW